jgi:hypothetical protein
MEWIDILQQQPELGIPVFVYIKHPITGVFNGTYSQKYDNYAAIGIRCCRGPRHWQIKGHDFKWPDEVVYWQPLPDIPLD